KSGEYHADNALGRVLTVAEQHPELSMETLELRLDEAILQETPRMERGIGMVKVIAAIAPMLGLLGTVTGMIGTFQAITQFGTGDPKIMAGGISMALITTVQGLVAAIPLILAHSLLQSRFTELSNVLEQQVAGILAERAESNNNGMERAA
ncbi:MAG: MotA/TolQ/ExbB proton channel family protein, partial [Aeromonas salmonicida]